MSSDMATEVLLVFIISCGVVAPTTAPLAIIQAVSTRRLGWILTASGLSGAYFAWLFILATRTADGAGVFTLPALLPFIIGVGIAVSALQRR